ncbi:hypothetical protein ACYSNX_02835 [Myroides sp. LJL115]
MQQIKLTDLSLSEIKELERQLLEKQVKEAEQRKNNIAILADLTEGIVDTHIDKFVNIQSLSNEAIVHLFNDANSIIESRVETYGNKKRDQDSHTFTKKDGSASIKIGWNIKPSFDGTESEGIVKIKEYMSSLASDDENEQIMMSFLNTFLKTDVQGNYNPKLVRKLNEKRDVAKSSLFNEGMDIIENAIVDIRTSMYARGYKMVEFEPGIEKRMEFSFSIR